MKLEPIKPFVKRELTEDERTRDNDHLLCGRIWFHELNDCEEPIAQLSAIQFIRLLIDGKVTSPEAITRVRRKLQEQCPELRGKTYGERHKQVKEVQEELRGFSESKLK